MKSSYILIVLLVLLPAVYAQLDWSITDLRCGNGVLDDFELCEEDLEEGFCDELATILEIDTVCDTQHCTCLPRVNRAYCGNDKREGVEVCDGTGPDMCPEYGNLTGLKLKCNPKTCGCSLDEDIPVDYSPEVVEDYVNATQISSVCGDKKVERNEDCDPPNTLCTAAGGDAGVCTEKCKCVLPGELDKKEEPAETPVVKEPETKVSENVSVSPAENATEEVSEPVEEKKGFFGSIWAWFVGLFS